jgi:hypothetical protein
MSIRAGAVGSSKRRPNACAVSKHLLYPLQANARNALDLGVARHLRALLHRETDLQHGFRGAP